MAAANTLHGVTMPEEGISQLVSVRVEDSEEFVEAAWINSSRYILSHFIGSFSKNNFALWRIFGSSDAKDN